MEYARKTCLLALLLSLAGCTAMSNDTNPPTGSFAGTAIGAGAGVGTAAVLGAHTAGMTVAGLAGATLGYYLTTLEFASGGIQAAGGHVYTMGDVVLIDLPTDRLFEANTADYLPGTEPLLNSVASVLARYPKHDIFIAGNTSGSWAPHFEQNMSECRANQVASSLWAHGITNSEIGYNTPPDAPKNIHPRRLIYVGYGNNFPIANDLHLKGIRANSHIQIVATLPEYILHWDKRKKHQFKPFNNIASTASANSNPLPPSQDYSHYQYAFSDDHTPASGTAIEPTGSARQYAAIPATDNAGTMPRISGNKDDAGDQFNTIIGTPPKSQAILAYNNTPSAPQTESGVREEKQRGFKDEDLKDEGASFGNSPR